MALPLWSGKIQLNLTEINGSFNVLSGLSWNSVELWIIAIDIFHNTGIVFCYIWIWPYLSHSIWWKLPNWRCSNFIAENAELYWWYLNHNTKIAAYRWWNKDHFAANDLLQMCHVLLLISCHYAYRQFPADVHTHWWSMPAVILGRRA